MRCHDFDSGNVWRLVLALSIPTCLSQAVNVLYAIVDRMFIGNMDAVGDIALAGVGVAVPITSLLSSFAVLIGMGGSPLMAISAKTAAAMQKALGEAFCVSWAMCYGTHRVAEVIAKAAQAAPERIVILPMFAQYATQTTEAVYDAVDRAVKKNPIGSEILRIRSYHNHPLYIEALAAGVRRHWEQAGALGEKGKVLMSFHGIPQASSDRKSDE